MGDPGPRFIGVDLAKPRPRGACDRHAVSQLQPDALYLAVAAHLGAIRGLSESSEPLAKVVARCLGPTADALRDVMSKRGPSFSFKVDPASITFGPLPR